MWQFVLVLFLVHREQGSLRWTVVKQALWLRAPHSPRTDARAAGSGCSRSPWCSPSPPRRSWSSCPAPVHRDQGTVPAVRAGQEFFSGNWPWFAVIVTMMVFNTVLGEELLFRGLLLPRMRGAFGRWDWAANGVLFGAYHLHVPWAIPGALLDTFILSYPSRRYRSAWIGIAVHSAQTVVFTALILALVLR